MKVYSYLDSGRPVLATRLPTHTQVLTDEVALLVEPEPEPMGRALAGLLRDRDLQERLAAAARDLTQREFTPQAFEGKLLHFYDSIAERIRQERLDGQTARLQAGHQGHR
jgi:glycosyltransferase involved in cell wall biosynthesis